METRLCARLRDASLVGDHRVFSWCHRRARRHGLAVARWSLSAACQLALHDHCHVADEQTLDGNPAAQCWPDKPRTDPGMGQNARGAEWTRRHRDRAFPLGFAAGFAAIVRATVPARVSPSPLLARRPRLRTSRWSSQFDAYRYVIRGSFVAARFLVDGNLDQPIRRSRRKQLMIDPNAVVALPSARLVIPECIKSGVVAGSAEGIDQAEVEKGSKARPGRGQKKRISLPGGGIGGVAGGRNHIVVTGEYERLLQRQKISYMRDEGIHEGELVGVFFGLRRIAVRQIDRGHADNALAVRDDRLDIPRLLVIGAARKPPRDLDWRLGKNRHAIKTFLPMHGGIIAFRLDFQMRKRRVDAFQLLEAKDIRLGVA